MCETATGAPLGVANHYHLISLHSPHRGAPGLRNTTPAPEKRAEDFSIAHHLLSAAPSRKAYYSYRTGGVSAGGDCGEGRPGGGHPVRRASWLGESGSGGRGGAGGAQHVRTADA
jgi:hypothetical protein